MRDLNTGNDGIARDQDRITRNGEVFTPLPVVRQMLDKIDPAEWADPEKTFLEPTMGSGNILVAMLERRIAAGVDPLQAVRTLYGVELMPDNVELCRRRVVETLEDNGVVVDKGVRAIIEHNLVCSDFFKWDFENWRPAGGGSTALDEFLC